MRKEGNRDKRCGRNPKVKIRKIDEDADMTDIGCANEKTDAESNARVEKRKESEQQDKTQDMDHIRDAQGRGLKCPVAW